VIALQNNPDVDFARGCPLTQDKATVYLSPYRGDLDKQEPNILELPKVKYPLVDTFSKPICFKLAGGYRFMPV